MTGPLVRTGTSPRARGRTCGYLRCRCWSPRWPDWPHVRWPGGQEPRQAVWLLTAASVALAACSPGRAGAGDRVVAAIRSPVLAAAGDYSLLAVRQADPVPALAGQLAAAAARRGRGRRHGGRDPTPRHRDHELVPARRDPVGPRRLVVLPGPAVDAYALPGGARRTSSPAACSTASTRGARAALVAHEHAHLTGRRYLFRAAAAASGGEEPAAACRWPARSTTRWSAGPTSTPRSI